MEYILSYPIQNAKSQVTLKRGNSLIQYHVPSPKNNFCPDCELTIVGQAGKMIEH